MTEKDRKKLVNLIAFLSYSQVQFISPAGNGFSCFSLGAKDLLFSYCNFGAQIWWSNWGLISAICVYQFLRETGKDFLAPDNCIFLATTRRFFGLTCVCFFARNDFLAIFLGFIRLFQVVNATASDNNFSLKYLCVLLGCFWWLMFFLGVFS